ELAGSTARTAKAGRKRILLVTDGQSVKEEDSIRTVARRLKEEGLGMTVVRTGGESTPALAVLREAGAEEVDGSDFGLLEARIGEALARSRELTSEPASGITFAGALASLQGTPRPGRVNRASLKPGSEVLARVGDVPVAAVRPAGRGRVAAALVALEEGWAGDLASWPGTAAFLAGLAQQTTPAAGRRNAEVSLRFEGDLLHIRASRRGPERPDRIDALLNGDPVALVRHGENTYAKTLRYFSDSAVLRIGGRVAGAARRPHTPEFDRVGPDEAALDRLAADTGGARISAPRDLAALPRRGPSERRSARPLILAAALALFLLEIAASLLPK
ncbi:MAG TPA: vWA domain-containing protein, partial [Planctomycetota bacterium]